MQLTSHTTHPMHPYVGLAAGLFGTGSGAVGGGARAVGCGSGRSGASPRSLTECDARTLASAWPSSDACIALGVPAAATCATPGSLLRRTPLGGGGTPGLASTGGGRGGRLVSDGRRTAGDCGDTGDLPGVPMCADAGGRGRGGALPSTSAEPGRDGPLPSMSADPGRDAILCSISELPAIERGSMTGACLLGDRPSSVLLALAGRADSEMGSITRDCEDESSGRSADARRPRSGLDCSVLCAWVNDDAVLLAARVAGVCLGEVWSCSV